MPSAPLRRADGELLRTCLVADVHHGMSGRAAPRPSSWRGSHGGSGTSFTPNVIADADDRINDTDAAADKVRLAEVRCMLVLFFINTWNQYLWPLLVASDKSMKTLPVGMQEFVSLEGGTNWGPLMAAATMAIVPALLAYVVAQRYVLESFVTAGLKE